MGKNRKRQDILKNFVIAKSHQLCYTFTRYDGKTKPTKKKSYRKES